MSLYKVGDTVICKGVGVSGDVGIPRASEGKEAKVKKVGRTRLQILIKGEYMKRTCQMTHVRRKR